MAEVAIAFVLEVLVEFLAKKTSIFGFNDQLKSLESELRAIKCFIKDADSRSERDNGRIKGWVNDLRQVAYDIEDVLDTLDAQAGSYYTRNDFKGTAMRYAHKPKEMIDLLNIKSNIEEIKKRIREIDERRKRLDIQNTDEQGDPRRHTLLERRKRDAREEYQPNDLVGLDKEINELVNKLVGEGQNSRRCVISVLGQAGVGKTALARQVYNRAKSRFWSCVWIHVSMHKSVEVLSELYKAVGFPRDEIKELKEGEMLEKIARNLKEEKYLVVLDDVRTREAWEAIRGALPDGNKGSRVLMTTQNEEVAKYADVHTPPCKLTLLNQEDSHKVLCRHAFPRYPHSCPHELKELANVIVKKCAGLPLALVAAGGILCGRKPNIRAWKHFVDGFSWDLTKSSAEISSMLALSFDDLNSQLKPCLLYCCAFPGNSEIRVKRLLSLWIAEGFVERQGQRQPEAVAMHYLDELVDRNLIQPCRWDSFGEIKSCRVHDVLRETLADKAKEQNFFQTHPTSNNYDLSKCRRLTTYDDLKQEAQPLCMTRSFISFAESKPSIWYVQIQNFKLIKVLDFEGVRSVETLPTEIGDLILLRYLGLRHTSIKTLPRSIKKLYNLQTLDLRSSNVRLSQSTVSFHLKAKHVKKMTSLRHLYFGDRHCNAFYAMDASDDFAANGTLKELQTLSYVKAGGWVEKGLRTMSNLKKMGIQVTDGDRSSCINLTAISKLSQLQNLHLHGRLDNVQTDAFGNLTKLTLDSSCLHVDPLSRLQKLQSLKILKLLNNAYIGSTMSCPEGGFPCLEVLNLENLEHLKDMDVVATGFSQLRYMRIASCIKLEHIPKGIENVSSLQELRLIDMGDRLAGRIKPVRGKERDRIMHIQSIIISTSH